MPQAIFLIVLVFLTTEFLILNQPVLSKPRSAGKNTVEPSKENFELGLSRYKAHDLDGAIDALLQAVYFNRSTYFPQAYYWLGVCYQDKKLDAKAIEALKKSVEQSIAPAPEAHMRLGELYLRNDRLEEAQSETGKAWQDYHKMEVPNVHNLLGLIAEKRGNLGGAQEQFIEALGEKPWRYTEAWMNYAECLMKQKDWGAAAMQFRAMLDHPVKLKNLDPEKIYLEIGICLLAKGDHQGAMDNWHECLNYNPDDAMAHLQLALLLDSERHISSAIKEYKEYIRLSPESPEVVKLKNRVLLLEQMLKSNQSESSLESNTENQPATNPSPYMRKKMEDSAAAQKKEIDKQRENSPAPASKESGF